MQGGKIIQENPQIKLRNIQRSWNGRCEFFCVPDVGLVLIEATVSCLPKWGWDGIGVMITAVVKLVSIKEGVSL
jgi:hypothetical protein